MMFLLSLAPPPAPQAIAYQCLDASEFMLLLSSEQAIVRFADGEYRLQRRSSALAVKYASKTATLYLEGDFAAFVAEDRPLPGCYKTKSGERG